MISPDVINAILARMKPMSASLIAIANGRVQENIHASVRLICLVMEPNVAELAKIATPTAIAGIS